MVPRFQQASNYRQTLIVRASRLCHKSAGTLAALSSRRPGEHEDIEL